MPPSTLVSRGQRRIGRLVGGGLRFGDGWVWGPYSGEGCARRGRFVAPPLPLRFVLR